MPDQPKDKPPTDDQINEAIARAEADKRGPVDDALHDRLQEQLDDRERK